jgi:DNA modification methylase
MKLVAVRKASEGTNSLARLSTNTLSSQSRVQRWANFIAGYSVEFVEGCISKHSPSQGFVIDPFMGCGTTIVAARNMGFSCVGFDRHPIFFNLADAKLRNQSVQEVRTLVGRFTKSKGRLGWSQDATTFLEKMFQVEDLRKINSAAACIPTLAAELQPLAVLLFLKACERTCGSQTDGIYKAPSTSKRSIPFDQAMIEAGLQLEADISSEWYSEHWIKQPSAKLINQSSTSLLGLKDSSVAACVTSPPYLNNFDYAEMTRMQLYLLGWADSWGAITRYVRNDLITNTTTALKGKKDNAYQFECRGKIDSGLHEEFDSIVLALAGQRASRAGKKDYDYLIYPYYAEINDVLLELRRVMKPQASIDWVVADAALYGVHIRTHLHTAHLLSRAGFTNVKVNKIRSRGERWVLDKRDGAKEGLGEYHISANRGA